MVCNALVAGGRRSGSGQQAHPGPVLIVQEAGWAPGPVWTGGKSRLHRNSIPDLPAHSQSLYRLSYRAHTIKKVGSLKHSLVWACNVNCSFHFCSIEVGTVCEDYPVLLRIFRMFECGNTPRFPVVYVFLSFCIFISVLLYLRSCEVFSTLWSV